MYALLSNSLRSDSILEWLGIKCRMLTTHYIIKDFTQSNNWPHIAIKCMKVSPKSKGPFTLCLCVCIHLHLHENFITWLFSGDIHM